MLLNRQLDGGKTAVFMSEGCVPPVLIRLSAAQSAIFGPSLSVSLCVCVCTSKSCMLVSVCSTICDLRPLSLSLCVCVCEFASE